MKLRELRIRAGLSQAALGQLVGITVASIYRLEAGKFQPKGKTLLALAKALNVRPEDIDFGGASDAK